jgi:hypothetical protein
MTCGSAAVVSFYERSTGIPFCREDMKALNEALAITHQYLVFRAVRQCSQWPPERPGFYLVKAGFASVVHLIDSNPRWRTVPKTKRTRVGSGLDDDVKEKPRDYGGLGLATDSGVTANAPFIPEKAPKWVPAHDSAQPKPKGRIFIPPDRTVQRCTVCGATRSGPGNLCQNCQQKGV